MRCADSAHVALGVQHGQRERLRQLAHGLQAPRLAVLRARMCSSTVNTTVNRSAGEPPSHVARTSLHPSRDPGIPERPDASHTIEMRVVHEIAHDATKLHAQPTVDKELGRPSRDSPAESSFEARVRPAIFRRFNEAAGVPRGILACTLTTGSRNLLLQ